MKLSRDWISDYVDLTGISDADLERRFTEIGHAIEAVEQHGDDTVFDLEITTNRVDAMSHHGMARELAAAFGRDMLSVAPAAPPAGPVSNVTILNEVSSLCRRFSAQVIRNVAVKDSPYQIQRRLEAVGLRAINNIVDITNYVMLSIGHPMHAYDLDKLAEQKIIVRLGRAGEKIKTL